MPRTVSSAVAAFVCHSVYPDDRRIDKWPVYLLGCIVFVAVLYFGLTQLLGLSDGISLAICIQGGVIGFFSFASAAQDWMSGGWDNGGA